jgi:hypothetical protein
MVAPAWCFLTFLVTMNQHLLVHHEGWMISGQEIIFLLSFKSIANHGCCNPTLAKCEDETHTPKVGDLESSETPECLEFDRKGQNTSPCGVLGVIRKVLKCRCPKWPRIGHLDICSPRYGQKKGRESNWQFDSRPLKVGNRPAPDVRWGSATRRWKALEEG